MALTGQIIVTPEVLKTQAETVKTELAGMLDYFDELERLMNGTAAYWTGEAGDAHRRLYASKRAMIEEIVARYREQVTDLEVIAGVYEQTESAVASAADSLPLSTLD